MPVRVRKLRAMTETAAPRSRSQRMSFQGDFMLVVLSGVISGASDFTAGISERGVNLAVWASTGAADDGKQRQDPCRTKRCSSEKSGGGEGRGWLVRSVAGRFIPP